jgi:SAM-dependent methyltransferase
MALICDYSEIASAYSIWSMGDAAYEPSADFYLRTLSRYTGVFAELGCGTGRIAKPLSLKEDVVVYGVDSCKNMLDLCSRDITQEMNLHLLLEDFLNFKLPQEADVIFMPFRTIGHILDTDGLHKLFSCVYENLKPNGLFIFDHYMFNKDWAMAHDDVDITMSFKSGVLIWDRYNYDYANKMLHAKTFVDGKLLMDYDFRWFDPCEVYAAFIQESFVLEALLGDFDNSIWTKDAPNQIWIIRRLN